MGARKRKAAKANRFRLILEAAPNAIVATDEEGRIVLVNAQTEQLFGYQRDELLGQPVEILVPQRFRDAHPVEREHFRATPVARQMGAGRDLWGLRRDGTEFPVEIGLNPVSTLDGMLVLASIVDITERKRAEAALREADRRKDEFLAMLAHELRNPLAPVANAVQVLQRLAPAEPRVQWAVALVERQVRHMSRLLDDLLDVSRITRGKVNVTRRRMDLREAVASAVETAAPLIEARHHHLELRLPERPVWVDGDATRLSQVVSNLLINAAKFTDDGGHIVVLLESAGGEALVRVRDDGQGIAPEMLPTVFGLFVQADQTLARSPGGLGIGLTLVRKLVELHDGRVEADSAGLGCGSEFVVRLPLAATEAAPLRQGEPPRQARPLRATRVLVVDDNPDAVESLAALLELHGYEVHRATSGGEALAQARKLAPDVVVLDIGLPDMDGFAVARQLRAEGLRPREVVALTGYGQAQDRERARAAGFTRYFTKPADARELREVLDGTAPR